jgi:hypothetical protein
MPVIIAESITVLEKILRATESSFSEKQRNEMKTKKRLEITIETHEVRTVRISERQATRFCEICRMTTVHLPVSGVAAMLRLSETAIFRLVETGRIHFVEGEGGSPLICTNSFSPEDSEQLSDCAHRPVRTRQCK